MSKLFKDFTILDGAMGTSLQKMGMPAGKMPEKLNIEKPEWITSVHESYIDAGAQIIYTNTFGANRYKLDGTGLFVSDVIPLAIANAKAAADGTETLVALDIGPIGQLLEPTGNLSFEEAYDFFKEQVECAEHADIIAIETMTDLLEMKAAVLAAKENSDKPVIATMTFEENKRTFTGTSVEAMVTTLEGMGVDALGVNCSLGPEDLIPIAEELCKYSDHTPIIVKANAGLPDPVTGEYSVGPDEFAKHYQKMIDMGVTVFGGCCGTNPTYIEEIQKMLATEVEKGVEPNKEPTVCSQFKGVTVDDFEVIGERLNPTGKKRFQQALREHDMDYILATAIAQVDAGADILDVNVGVPDIDEKAMMVDTVKALQAVVDVPLQIDSTKPEVIEAALRVYNGVPIVNSVNGEDEVMEAILPIVAKYGAMVIGLTLDKDGIPDSAEARVKIAEKIIKKAEEYGIARNKIIIDTLTMTVSAEQEAANITLAALEKVKALGVKTALGVSNVSFGLPNRPLINETFKQMAIEKGLDLAIVNPNAPKLEYDEMAARVLRNEDKNAEEYIKREQSKVGEETPEPESKEDITILYAMEKGLKAEAKQLTEKMLETESELTIINETLIPALDAVGDKFEKGTIFLPQLITAAEVAKECFDIIKTRMANANEKAESKGKVILATVKGDIHDIGKNIVKVILENYGYDIIDLGRDVDPQIIVDSARENEVKLVGLSALMTTTLGAMEETIRLLKESGLDCKTFVGGAVLTEDYAMKINADFYAKDAKMSADICKKVLG